jgi:hypothetical protein
LSSITTSASQAATNNPWNLNIKVATVSSGASGTLIAHGPLAIDLGALSTAADSIFNDQNTAASSAINLTGALYVDFTVATSAGNAGNSFTQQIGTFEPASAQGATGSVGATGPTGAAGTVTSVTGSAPISSSGGATPAISCATCVTFSIYPTFTTPASSSFTWVNQASASMTDISTPSGIRFAFPGAANTQISCAEKAIPSTPYTIDAGMEGFTVQGAGGIGLAVMTDGTTGATVHLNFMQSAGSTSSFTGSPAYWVGLTNSVSGGIGTSFSYYAPIQFARITDNGTTRNYYVSVDGQNFSLSYTEAHAAATKVGICGYNSNGNAAYGGTLVHYLEH